MKRRVIIPLSKEERYRGIKLDCILLIKDSETGVVNFRSCARCHTKDESIVIDTPIENLGQLLVDYLEPHMTTTKLELEE